MKTRRAAKFSAEQTAYMTALAAFQTIDESFTSTASLCPVDATEEEEDAFDMAREEVRETCGWLAAKSALMAAEDVMVRWSLAYAARYAAANATPEQAATVAGLYDRARRSFTGWRALVDVASRLAA